MEQKKENIVTKAVKKVVSKTEAEPKKEEVKPVTKKVVNSGGLAKSSVNKSIEGR